MRIVGWRERDWARFTDEERRIFYGSARPSARFVPPASPPARAEVPTRASVWKRPLSASELVVTVVGIALLLGLNHWGVVTHLLRNLWPVVPAVPPAQVRPIAPAPPTGYVCTAQALGADGRWHCTSYRIVAAAPPAALR